MGTSASADTSVSVAVSSSEFVLFDISCTSDSWELISLVLSRDKKINIMVSDAGFSSAPSGYRLKLLCW